jgi:hypothetical protein
MTDHEHRIPTADVLRLLTAVEGHNGEAIWGARCGDCGDPLKWDGKDIVVDSEITQLADRFARLEVGDTTYIGEREDTGGTVKVLRRPEGWLIAGAHPDEDSPGEFVEDAVDAAGEALDALAGVS